ncbi:phosphotransferase [Nonomuraea sp. NPDC002799]
MTMDGGRRFVQFDAELAGLAGAVFGKGRRLVAVDRLRGGSKKGVYRLAFEDGFSAVLYAWNDEEDFWPADSHGSADDPFGHASGLRLFEASHTRLSALGVRVPAIYHLDPDADLVLIEDVRGANLETLLQDDPARGEQVLERLAVVLEAMAGHRAPLLGRVADAGVRRPAVDVVLERALADLAEAAVRVERIGHVRDGFEAALRELAALVEPRGDYGLIHGELGPDHVLVGADGEPVLIDIEGTMFFDVEWEHVFLGLRFAARHYARLRPAGLDERRMRLYRLAQHLSLVAGPLRLLDGDFPDRRFMMEIATTHTERALRFLREGPLR